MRKKDSMSVFERFMEAVSAPTIMSCTYGTAVVAYKVSNPQTSRESSSL